MFERGCMLDSAPEVLKELASKAATRVCMQETHRLTSLSQFVCADVMSVCVPNYAVTTTGTTRTAPLAVLTVMS